MTAETITQISFADLHDSPFNPREVYHEVDDAELTADIKAHGRILQPLLVRPRIGPLFGNDPDAAAGYEVVFGHRRKRFGEAAGLPTAPCMVRAMSDAEARRAQISENLARKDVHPIEEAKSFQSLIDNDGETADTIAEKFGKSRSYVYGRLKLLDACPEIRKACLAGEIGSEVALLIARLRTGKLQEKALGYIKADYHCKLDDGGKASYRSVRQLLSEKFTLDLKKAMFDVEDEMLLPLAGNCVTCPKRSSNAPEFEDVLNGDKDGFGWHAITGANVCTDPDCFDAKKKAHLKREADKLTAEGKVVVQGNTARNAISAHGEIKGGYIALKDVQAELKKLPKKGGSAAQDAPAPAVVLIQDPRTGKTHKAVKAADVKAAGVKVKEKPKADDWAAREEQRRQDQQKAQVKADAENQLRLDVLDHVRAHVATSERDAFDLRLVANAAIAGVQWNDREILLDLWAAKSLPDLAKKIDAMSATDITRLVMDCGLVRDLKASHHNVGDKPKVLYAVAAHYGINVDKIRAAAKAEPTPASAARAPAKGKAAPAPEKGKSKAKKALRADELKNEAGSDAQVDAFEGAEA